MADPSTSSTLSRSNSQGSVSAPAADDAAKREAAALKLQAAQRGKAVRAKAAGKAAESEEVGADASDADDVEPAVDSNTSSSGVKYTVTVAKQPNSKSGGSAHKRKSAHKRRSAHKRKSSRKRRSVHGRKAAHKRKSVHKRKTRNNKRKNRRNTRKRKSPKHN